MQFRHVALVLFWSFSLVGAGAQSTVFVVRHADRGPEEPDAHLTEKGERQARQLAGLLADAGIRHVYTTEFTRTQQTAAPTATRAKVVPVVVPQAKLDELIAHVRASLRDGEATLVVGHRSSVPRIVRALSGREIAPLASGEFTRVVVLTLFADGRSSVATLRSGLDPEP